MVGSLDLGTCDDGGDLAVVKPYPERFTRPRLAGAPNRIAMPVQNERIAARQHPRRRQGVDRPAKLVGPVAIGPDRRLAVREEDLGSER
jgi:hypothetical protein